MVAKDSPDELPSGWTVLCKVLRTGREVSIYTNLETGKRFFSKDDLFKHIKFGSSHSDKPLPTKKEISQEEESTSPEPEPVNENDEHPEWLPKGWKIEVRIRKSGVHSGKEYKCYIDPSSSGKFYSKQEVLRHLEAVKDKSEAHQDDSENHKSVLPKKKTKTLKQETKKIEKDTDTLEKETETLDKETNTLDEETYSHDKVAEQKIDTNLETGKIFFSKGDLSKNINSGSCLSDKHLPTKKEISRQEKSTPLKPEPVNENDEHPEWLPNGWKIEVRIRKSGVHNGKEYKCYIDPSNSGKFYSKQEVLRYLKAVKRKNQAHQDDTENHKTLKLEINTLEKETETHNMDADTLEGETGALDTETDASMDSEQKVVIQKCVAEDLPPGWIKEIRTRHSSTTIRKDPYYTDPVSGYVFRSKKEALRYVQTGVIGKHAFKPKKPPTDHSPELNKDEVSPSSGTTKESKNLPNKAQLFSGKKGSETSDLELSKTGRAKLSSPKVSPDEISQGKRPLDDTTQECTQSKKKCAKISSPLPKDEGSKRSRDKGLPFSDASVSEKVRVAENWPISTPTQDNGIAKEARFNPRKSTVKNVPELPHRSSKRLAGHEPDRVMNLELGERAIISAIKKGKKPEAVHDVNPTYNGSVQVETKPEAAFSDRASNRAKKSTRVTPEKTNPSPETPDPQLSFLFGSDPCLDFAFKTLIGELPLDNNNPPENGPTLACKNLPESGPNKRATTTTRSKSKNKKEDLNLPRRSSKRLSRAEPEIASEQKTPQNVTTLSTSTQAELRLFETPQTTNEPEIPEPDLSFSIADYWSDPCLDFAFKTLTGVIPIEDTLVQGYFQEQVDVSNSNNKNVCVTLPDFGSSNIFQTDISSQFDGPEKSSVGFPSCSNGVHSKQQSMEGNKDLHHQKVKS